MSRFRLPLVLACLLVPSLIPAIGPDADPQTKLSPAMHRLFEDEAGPYRVWVFFADKGLTDRAAQEQAIADVAASYDRRAVKRRQLRGRNARNGGPLFDARDLPVHEAYVDQVAGTGARVRIRSRWVNAVSAVATRSQIDAIAALPSVVKVQPVARSKRPEILDERPAEAPEGPASTRTVDYGRSTEQLTQINLIALHEDGYTGEGVIVGILDTGFRRDHVAFHQPGHELVVVAEYDFVDDDPDASNEAGDPSSQHNHGTMILGTLGSYYPGELVGGAYGASFALAKTEDTTGEYPAEEDNYVAGLEFLEAHGVDMTTSSLGYIDWYTQADLDGETAVTTIAINMASDAGVHTVTAAGNEYHDSNPATSSLIAPADAFSIITCGAVSSSGSIAFFSSDGPTADGRVKPELLARGSSTSTISPSSTTGFTTADGTSLSTPLVAGAVASLIQAHPNWTVEDMREALFTYADTDPGGLGFDPLYIRGYGIVNAMESHVSFYNPAGFVLLQDDVYSCDDTIEISLRDDNIPGDPPTIEVALSSTTEVDPESVTLTQIAPGSGRYTGTFATSSASPEAWDGALSVNHGDVVTVEYIDANDGEGGINVSVTDDADVDCVAPVITGVESHDVMGVSAWIRWVTDEPADSHVTYGTTLPVLTTSVDELVTAHDVRLTGLQECSPYLFSVSSADQVGNSATSDNLGVYYAFETGKNVNPTYPTLDPPIAIPDNDPTGAESVIVVEDDEPIVDLDVQVFITHTYDGDLELSLIGPGGIEVTLSDRHGGSGDGFNGTIFDDEAETPIGSGSAPFAGSFRPDGLLSTFDDMIAAGEWRLRVEDHAGIDVGTIDSWSLILSYPPQACGPSLESETYVMSDECSGVGSGSSNGRIEPAEDALLNVTLHNDGSELTTGVTARLSTTTPGVTITQDLADYPDLEPDESADSPLTPFAFTVDAGVECGATIQFTVEATANEGGWTSNLSLIVGDTPYGPSCDPCAVEVPEAVSSLEWDGTESLQWSPATGATFYCLYRGDRVGLPNLMDEGLDSCRRLATSALATEDVLDEAPAADSIYWYLVVAGSGGGEGPAGSGSGGPRIVNYEGACP